MTAGRLDGIDPGSGARAWGPMRAALLVLTGLSLLWSANPGALSHSGGSVEAIETAPETAIAMRPDGREIEFSGPFDEGVAERFSAFLEAHPEATGIRLTSEGGYVDEAERVGDLIAGRRLVTSVSTYCVSACTLAFARGQERLLLKGARLGFHSPYTVDGLGQDVQVDGEAERLAYIAAGVAPDFAAEAVRVASSEIWIPDPDRLISARVVTGLVDPDPSPADGPTRP